MALTKSDEYTTDWHQRTSSGVIPVATVIILIVLFSVGANIFKILQR
jgi:hypothetical protein